MKTLTTLVLSMLCWSAVACEGALLDQDFRRLASTEEVNLCEAYTGNVVLVCLFASKTAPGFASKIAPP